jgi:hypothetical protein
MISVRRIPNSVTTSPLRSAVLTAADDMHHSPGVPGEEGRDAVRQLTDRSGAALSGTIVLDKFGVVRYSGAAVALIVGREDTALRDRPVQDLLPGLPLKTATPGYNIAYLTFWARSRRTLHTWAETGDGGQVLCDLVPHALRLDEQYVFVIEISAASDPAVACGEVSF